MRDGDAVELAGGVGAEVDLRLAEDLALRAGTAVENARLYRARTKIAQTLQASLLPPLLPDVPGAVSYTHLTLPTTPYV